MISRPLKGMSGCHDHQFSGVSQAVVAAWQHQAVCYFKEEVCPFGLNVLWFLLDSLQVWYCFFGMSRYSFTWAHLNDRITFLWGQLCDAFLNASSLRTHPHLGSKGGLKSATGMRRDFTWRGTLVEVEVRTRRGRRTRFWVLARPCFCQEKSLQLFMSLFLKS